MSRLREFLAIGLAMANTELLTTPVIQNRLLAGHPHPRRGRQLRATEGIIFDDNDVLQTSFEARQIIVMDPETGEVLDTLGPEIGVDVPDDLIRGRMGRDWTPVFVR